MQPRLNHARAFARSLALASTLILPACTSTTESSNAPGSNPADEPPATADPEKSTENTEQRDAATDAVATVKDAGTDTGGEPTEQDGGAIKGPIPPPELPESFV